GAAAGSAASAPPRRSPPATSPDWAKTPPPSCGACFRIRRQSTRGASGRCSPRLTACTSTPAPAPGSGGSPATTSATCSTSSRPGRTRAVRSPGRSGPRATTPSPPGRTPSADLPGNQSRLSAWAALEVVRDDGEKAVHGMHEPGVGGDGEADDDRGEVSHQYHPVGRGGPEQQGEHPGEDEQDQPDEQAVIGDARRRVAVLPEHGQAHAAGDHGQAARGAGDDGDRQQWIRP